MLEGANGIIGALEAAGYEAYAVGGCVRDALTLRDFDDIDIATNATPAEIKKVFSRTIDTGIAHGTVTVFFEKNKFEVTTYRTDGEYADHRRPDSVAFSKSLFDDLSRRDFTVNAMAYHPTRGLVDEFSGIDDLNDKIIRTVGEPKTRFSEDALRMMRAVRFCATHGFTLCPDTYDAIVQMHELICHVSAERICDELSKIILSDRPEDVYVLYQTGLMQHFLPELCACFMTTQNNQHHIYDVGTHTLCVMKNVKPDLSLRLAAMLHDIAKPECKTTDDFGIDHFKGHPEKGAKTAAKILTRLRYPKAVIKKVCRLILWHDYRFSAQSIEVKRALSLFGDDLFYPLMELKCADATAQNPELSEQKLETIRLIKEEYARIKNAGEPYLKEHLAIGGDDLKAAGIKESKAYAEIFEKLTLYVTENPHKNTKEDLLEASTKIMEERSWNRSE